MTKDVVRSINQIPLEDADTKKALEDFKTDILAKAIFDIEQTDDGKVTLTYGDGHTKEISIKAVLA